MIPAQPEKNYRYKEGNRDGLLIKSGLLF